MAKFTVGYTSAGIGKIDALAALLPEFSHFSRLQPLQKKPDAVVGWGLKPSSIRARRYAKRHNLPYIALEDGFLRSLGLGVAGYQRHSLVVDYTGIYYDASRPSDLENWLNTATFTEDELNQAERCIQQIVRYRLSKYNHAPDRTTNLSSKASVLVVDQTAGDASIEYGGASADSFDEMLNAALENHPDAEILVKIHPDVIAGKKQGHLLKAQTHPRCHVVSEDINPWTLFDQVDTVYVVTSQLGFEALLAGKRVHCFGLPFYTGWGLTQDRQPCTRRRAQRTLNEVFAAAYLRYARYANPYTLQSTTLEDTIALIADQKRQQERLRGEWLACGFSSWKRRFIHHFTGSAARVAYQEALPAAPPEQKLLVWSSRIDQVFEQQHAELMPHLWRIEDGFIRSVGLGVDLTQPLSLVIDSQGIYYDPSRPSDLETLLQQTVFSDDLLERAAHLRERLVALKLSKYNVRGQDSIELPANRLTILVPGQVESDASIATGSPEIRTNSALLRAVRQANPDAFIIYKAHPDVITGARIGALEPDAKRLYDLDASHMDIASLLERVDAVHTMSSLTGFEALLRHRQVVTYGMPFYAAWGLTQDAMHCERRSRRLSLDALVAGTLILYPSYVDPQSRQLCNAETVVSLLEQARTQQSSLTWKQRLYRLYRNLLIGRH
ncbi:capsular polysaccharide biosynthesis protein [Vreelandella populi]|uniref:Capsular polysaccharide biosynthesis protein n=1 Tax=Vreelandella populi TaxID=2498858 RepID=A0A433LBD3_9GAMM|nr:capsular polysaccharide biosynthesis protein [Halomonas populi]RUR42416.1 capsular polysaccharide biosynthesis protein [Halomonas populi]RUR45979.1 capsular polysaccharide biosynthesis protein [Halomonas populi]